MLLDPLTEACIAQVARGHEAYCPNRDADRWWISGDRRPHGHIWLDWLGKLNAINLHVNGASGSLAITCVRCESELVRKPMTLKSLLIRLIRGIRQMP